MVNFVVFTTIFKKYTILYYLLLFHVFQYKKAKIMSCFILSHKHEIFKHWALKHHWFTDYSLIQTCPYSQNHLKSNFNKLQKYSYVTFTSIWVLPKCNTKQFMNLLGYKGTLPPFYICPVIHCPFTFVIQTFTEWLPCIQQAWC